VVVKKLTDSVQVYSDPTMVKSTASTAAQSTTAVAVEPTIITNTVTQYVPVFYLQNAIAVSQTSHLVRSGAKQSLAFGQGKLSIAVTPFDNTFKFQVKTESTNDQGTSKLNNMDLTQFSGFELVFGSASSKISIASVTDQSLVNADLGEILFKVDATTTSKIQNLDDPKFYIVTVGKDGSRSALYTGKWYKSDDIAQADADNSAELAVAKKQVDLADTVASLQERIGQLETENANLRNSTVNIKVSQPAGSVVDTGVTDNPITLTRPVSGYGKMKYGKNFGRPGSGGMFIEDATQTQF
jgi:hypothetical protein